MIQPALTVAGIVQNGGIGAMADRIIWGVVSPTGEIISGTGFIVDQVEVGIYTVLFREQYNATPGVTATQIYPNDIRSTGGDTRDNAVLVGILNDRFKVKTGDSNGKASNRNFSFIAIGT